MNSNQLEVFCAKCLLRQGHFLFESDASYPFINFQDRSEIMQSKKYALILDLDKVFLAVRDGKDRFEISVDFSSGENEYRRLHGGGRGQAVAKAVGIKKGFIPRVLDMTAGMGSDAFVLASLGCDVTLLERNPIVIELLQDGLRRAKQDAHERNDSVLLDVLNRMRLKSGSALKELPFTDAEFDTVYLDPMFPERKKKSALVKKEMRVFHDIVGADEDADELLAVALRLAKKRVTVKRPKLSPLLASKKPNIELAGKSTRYDIYFPKTD